VSRAIEPYNVVRLSAEIERRRLSSRCQDGGALHKRRLKHRRSMPQLALKRTPQGGNATLLIEATWRRLVGGLRGFGLHFQSLLLGTYWA
jgi:hypothetical protein